MPSRSASRRIVRPAIPSSSRSARASPTISARRLDGTDEAVAVAEAVPGRTIHRDVRRPCQSPGKPRRPEPDGEDGEHGWPSEDVEGVVEPYRAGMELALPQSPTSSKEQGDVGEDEERPDLPRAYPGEDDRAGEQAHEGESVGQTLDVGELSVDRGEQGASRQDS